MRITKTINASRVALCLVAASTVLFTLSAGATDLVGETSATFQWTPASGPVVEYAVFVNLNGAGFGADPDQVVSSTSVTLNGVYGDSLVIKVAARDDRGNQGPFSSESEIARFVALAPILSLSTASLSTSATSGDNPGDLSFAVANAGFGTLDYSISANAAWLNLSLSTGTATTETDTIGVSFDMTGLGAGTHSAIITVSATGLPSKTIAVDVEITLQPGVLAVNTGLFETHVTQGFNGPSTSFEVSNAGEGSMSYTISANADWLILSPTTDTVSSEIDTIAVSFLTHALTKGTYNATITVTAEGSSSGPHEISVQLEVLAPLGAPGTPCLVLINP
jgi:hypothetical protein